MKSNRVIKGTALFTYPIRMLWYGLVIHLSLDHWQVPDWGNILVWTMFVIGCALSLFSLLSDLAKEESWESDLGKSPEEETKADYKSWAKRAPYQ